MNRNPLIGISICAVVLLVLGSLSNVVGYQSVKSTVNDSPLFQTRTQRATNQQQNILTSRYLGMGKGNLLQFQIRDNTTEQLKKAIDIISKMGEKTFAQFKELCIQKARQDNTLQDISDHQIVQTLLLLKANPKAILYSFTNRTNQDITSSGLFSLCQNNPFKCIYFDILFLITAAAVLLMMYIEYLKEGPTFFTCISYCMCFH